MRADLRTTFHLFPREQPFVSTFLYGALVIVSVVLFTLLIATVFAVADCPSSDTNQPFVNFMVYGAVVLGFLVIFTVTVIFAYALA
ncbi:hypothetical protein MRX96_043980, partial [Rhipicephalus microplus]